MNNIMLDIETLDTKDSSVVLSIGAVKFNGTDIGDKFYAVLDIDEQITAGRTVSGNTLRFWAKQDEEAKRVFSEAQDTIFAVLAQLNTFMGDAEYKVWGNGAVFDNAIMTSLYNSIGFKRPWTYKNDRCYRTVRAEFMDRNPTAQLDVDYGVKHNAVDDAVAQALTLQQIWEAQQ